MGNPVTRFGRGFHGFAPAADLSSARPNAYGPGVDRVPPGSTRYTIGNTGKPLRPGDAALSPDLVRQYGLRNGDYFTYKGKTYRYNDQSYITKGRPNVNTVEIWYPAGQKPGQTASAPRPSRTPTPVAEQPRQLAENEWQSSPTERRFLPPEGSGRGFTERSASLTTNPNDDWIGSAEYPDPQSETYSSFADYQAPSAEIAPSGPQTPSVEVDPGARTEPTPGRSVALTTDPNEDWIGADPAPGPELFSNPDAGTFAVSPGLSGETLDSLPNEPYRPAVQMVEAGAGASAPTDEWWKQPTNGFDMTVADAGDASGGTPAFGAPDLATGTFGGFTDEGDSHAFEFTGADEPAQVAEATYPAPQSEEVIPNTEYGPDYPDPIAETEPFTFEEHPDVPETPPEQLYAENGPDPTFDQRNRTQVGGGNRYTAPGEVGTQGVGAFLSVFNTARNLNYGTESPVGGGNIDLSQTGRDRFLAGGDTSTGPNRLPTGDEIPGAGDFTPMDVNSEAEAQGARETAALRAAGKLPPEQPGGRPKQPGGGQGPPDPWTGYRPGASGPGYGANPSQMADLGLMGWVAQHDNVNDMSAAVVEGQPRFGSGVFRMDDQGGFERVGERVSGYRRPTYKAIVGRTINGRPWQAPAPAGRSG